ncbi:alpha/beta hydrolase [Vampirovibrio sp.]|uniref:alpha/beta hydrolase n=1 Tax=Vampirovibrio sp. TaxID=2717857 RepID=UPI003593410D
MQRLTEHLPVPLRRWSLNGVLTLRYAVDVVKMFSSLCVWALVFIPLPRFMGGTAKRIEKFSANRFLKGPQEKPDAQFLKDKTLRSIIENKNEHFINIQQVLKENQASALKGRFKADPLLDDITVHAWHIPAPAGRPTVILHHGRGSNIMHLEPVMRTFRDQKMGIIVYDYPGFGRSGGAPSPEALYKSGLAVSLYAKQRMGAKIPVKDQIILGNSLGSIVAANTAHALELLGEVAPKALVLANPLPSLKKVFVHNRDRFKLGWLFNEKRMTLDLDAEAPLKKLTHTPVQIIRGKQDQYIPMAQVDQMFRQIGKPEGQSLAPYYENGAHLDKTLLGETHHRLKDRDYPLLAAQIDRFIQRTAV